MGLFNNEIKKTDMIVSSLLTEAYKYRKFQTI